MSDVVLRLKPEQYVHIHDNNTGVTSLVSGPETLTLASHQSQQTKGPQPFIVVPPQCYAIIENPILRDKDGNPVVDKHGQIKNQLGEREVRFFQPPFPLYPNELLVEAKPITVLTDKQALVLKALRDFTEVVDGKEVRHDAGDEYLFRGPGLYPPQVEVVIAEKREATIVKFNESIKLRAKNNFVDSQGRERKVGDEYLWAKPGAYMVGVDEQFVSVVPATILTPTKAIHVEVQKGYVDERPWAKKERKAGEVYIITNQITSEFIPDPAERIIKEVPLITVTRKQWAVILDPCVQGVPQLGRRKVITNTTFFLEPGERLEGGAVKDIYVLGEDEAVRLEALEEFTDNDVTPPQKRISGETWLLCGPREYIPNSSVQVMKDKTGKEKRSKFVLTGDDGVYVRNILSGEVRAVTGCTYMLQADEELWEKELPKVIEEKLSQQGKSHTSYIEKGSEVIARDRTRVVRYRIPYNSVTQVYDYRTRKQRLLFGPDEVVLGPDEHFSVLNLSGSEWDASRPNVCLPKKTGMIKALYLYLGPASLSDVVNVETRDHARLGLQLSYDWFFDIEHGNEKQATEAFSVTDFVGDCCSCVASRVRASIASVSFEHFHKHSSDLVRAAVFGIDSATAKPKKELRFKANRLVVTSVDIQQIEVLDSVTRDALQQSVKMAIEITTTSQQNAAQQEASVREQQARGKLERQKIEDMTSAEVTRKELLQVETQCAAIASTGQAKAEARARATAAEIQGDNAVAIARTNVKAATQMDKARLEMEQKKSEVVLSYQAEKDALEIEYQKKHSEIESGKFNKVMEAIGKGTVQEISRAGPEMQAKLLKSLGLEGYLVTDGTNPINLFNTAKGMTAPPTAAPH